MQQPMHQLPPYAAYNFKVNAESSCPPGVPLLSVSNSAAAEKLESGYYGRSPMWALLAPDIVEAITERRQPAEHAVHVLREGFPVE
jgi:hypothetical protein